MHFKFTPSARIKQTGKPGSLYFNAPLTGSHEWLEYDGTTVEDYDGRSVTVRFVISDITSKSIHFEQAFSVDGGKSWEVNWVATDTRVP